MIKKQEILNYLQNRLPFKLPTLEVIEEEIRREKSIRDVEKCVDCGEYGNKKCNCKKQK